VHSAGFHATYDDIWILDGVRTPMVDYCTAFSQASPTDMGIKVAREILARTGVLPHEIGSVITGNMAPGDFYQYFIARHIGLYSGVPLEVPALNVQRICGTGLELFRQAADQITLGYADSVLAVGTESMTRNPVAAFSHRTGFRLGAPVEFKDSLWEALVDPAVGITMLQTAEILARRYSITRNDVDAYASLSHARAMAAQASGFLAGEIAVVTDEVFECEGYQPRQLRLGGAIRSVAVDTHARPSPVEVLARLHPLYAGGVQTAGNSSALVDGAAAALVVSGDFARRRGAQPLARILAASVVGVAPNIMGIGPVPAIRLLLERTGLRLDEIGLFEINEAQGAQIVAVERELGLDRSTLNVNGGAIALGHPLAATGVRLATTVARAVRQLGLRYGVASACIGGGQGIALLVENPQAMIPERIL
jgi:acetyl-CoA C-acetyltransferase